MSEIHRQETSSIEGLLGILTLEEKLEHHKAQRITFNEAIHKQEFWTVNALTLGRLFVGVYAIYLAFDAVDSSQLVLPALLTTVSWIADYFDGSYARRHKVCTDLGNFLDHGLSDFAMAVNTIAIPIFLLTK